MQVIIYTIGIIHTILYVAKNTYGFYYFYLPQSFCKYYLWGFILLAHSWIFYNNECIVSYLVKKINNPEYCAGDDPCFYEDIFLVFHNNKNLYKKFEFIMTVCYIYSLIVINNQLQSPIPDVYWITTMVCYLGFPVFSNIFFMILCIDILYLL